MRKSGTEEQIGAEASSQPQVGGTAGCRHPSLVIQVDVIIGNVIEVVLSEVELC